MTPGNEFYSEEDAQTILRLASQSGTESGMSREQLVQVAAELGLNGEAIDRAEAQLSQIKAERQAKADEDQARSEYRKQVFSCVRNHFLIYLGVNAGLMAIWALSGMEKGVVCWPILSILGWGIGLASQAFSTLTKGSFESGFREWQQKRTAVEAGRQIFVQKQADQPPMPIESFMSHLVETGIRSRLEAIRAYQNVTGCDLMTAQQVVDDFAHRNPLLFQK